MLRSICFVLMATAVAVHCQRGVLADESSPDVVASQVEQEVVGYLSDVIPSGRCAIEIHREEGGTQVEATMSFVYDEQRVRMTRAHRVRQGNQWDKWSTPWHAIVTNDKAILWVIDNNGALIDLPTHYNNLYMETQVFWPQFIGMCTCGAMGMPQRSPRGFLASADRAVQAVDNVDLGGVPAVHVTYTQMTPPLLEVWYGKKHVGRILKVRESVRSEKGIVETVVDFAYKEWAAGVWFPESVTTTTTYVGRRTLYETIKVTSFKTEALADSEFELASLNPPEGMEIVDSTSGQSTLFKWVDKGMREVDLSKDPKYAKRIPIARVPTTSMGVSPTALPWLYVINGGVLLIAGIAIFYRYARGSGRL